MAGQIAILIADDHPIVRKGLREVIEAEGDLKVVAEADDGEAAVALIAKLRPRIAVLDLHMPKMGGFRVQEELRKRNDPVDTIFLTMHNEADLLHRAMDLGGKGYILKESALVEIVSGIRCVAAGQLFVSSSMTAALLSRRAQAQRLEHDMLGGLTPSERRILSMIAAGKATKVIAEELYIHQRTVETHRANICQKLGLNGANSLLRFALEHRSELLA
jgi:DNA-binding NarL/FixJ family response regulator